MIIPIQKHRYISHFKKLGATSPGRAIVPSEYNIRKSLAFNKLLREEILIEITRNRYYLDEVKEKIIRQKRRMIILILVIVLSCALVLSLIILDYFKGDEILHISQW